MSALDWLYGLQGIGVKLGLDNMRRLLAALDPPPNPPLTIHVAGTNGKGSVCAFVDAIARAHGLKTGLFTSPHLVRFQERIRIDGQAISSEDANRWLMHLREIVARWEPHPSFFELTLGLAMAYYYERQIECLVLETGLGGRLDATNAVEPRHVAVVTPIHYDHMRILGDTLDVIAREKAGIFRPNVPIVSAVQPPEAERALRQAAEAVQAPISFIQAPYEGDLPLAGRHQRDNAALAVAAFQSTAHPVSAAHVQLGLQQTQWHGRFQEIGSRYVIDAAHNIASIAALVDTWRQHHGNLKATIIFGCARDKQPREILSLLAPIARRIIIPRINSQRSEVPENLCPLIGLEAHAAGDLAAALARAERHKERILITGSLFLAGEALAYLTGQPPPVPTTQ